MKYDFTMCTNEECPLTNKCERNYSHYKGLALQYQSFNYFTLDNSCNCFIGEDGVVEKYFKSKGEC